MRAFYAKRQPNQHKETTKSIQTIGGLGGVILKASLKLHYAALKSCLSAHLRLCPFTTFRPAFFGTLPTLFFPNGSFYDFQENSGLL